MKNCKISKESGEFCSSSSGGGVRESNWASGVAAIKAPTQNCINTSQREQTALGKHSAGNPLVALLNA